MRYTLQFVHFHLFAMSNACGASVRKFSQLGFVYLLYFCFELTEMTRDLAASKRRDAKFATETVRNK